MKKTTNVIDIPISENCLDYGLQIDQSASTTEMAETIANRLRTINNLSMASLSTEMDGRITKPYWLPCIPCRTKHGRCLM